MDKNHWNPLSLPSLIKILEKSLFSWTENLRRKVFLDLQVFWVRDSFYPLRSHFMTPLSTFNGWCLFHIMGKAINVRFMSDLHTQAWGMDAHALDDDGENHFKLWHHLFCTLILYHLMIIISIIVLIVSVQYIRG